MNQRAKAESLKVRGQSEQLFRELAHTGDDVLRGKLIDAHQSLVHYLAGKFANRGEPLEDLISVGNIGLVKAVDRYDPERGVKFSTFATPTIVGEIRRHFRDKTWALKVPRRLQELNYAAAKASQSLSQALGRPATVQEIAREVGVSEEETLEALELANAYDPLSVDTPQGEDSSNPAPQDVIGASDDAFNQLELRNDLARAMDSLGERERDILALRFFHDMSQTEVAKRLNISQMHVSRLQNKALKRLEQILKE